MKISEILPAAALKLASSGVPEYVRESSTILQFALSKDRVFLISYPEYELNAIESERFENALRRRMNREPLQYITGRQEFYGLNFKVTPDVLIPRPETEMLVSRSVELLRQFEKPSFAEIGVGSGCIAVSILYNVAKSTAVGVDISPSAIEVSRGNAVSNGVDSRLELIESDLFANFPQRRFNLIVSNPPYVPAADIGDLQPEVGLFEPRRALTDGGNGLSIMEQIIKTSPRFMKTGGFFVVEIGIGQAASARQFFDRDIWSSVAVRPDFQGIPRMIVANLVQ